MSKTTIYERIFGKENADTNTLAEAAKSTGAESTGESFLTRSLKIFHVREDLDEAYVRNKGELKKYGEKRGGLTAFAAITGFVLCFASMISIASAMTVVGALTAPALLVVCLATLAVSSIIDGKDKAKATKVEKELDSNYATADRGIEQNIRSLQLTLEEQTPDVRQQFNDAFNISLTKRNMLDQRIAAGNLAEATKNRSSSNAGSNVAIGAVAGVAIGSALD